MKVPRKEDGLHPKGDDLRVKIAHEKRIEKVCASDNCSSMPARQKMQIKVIICLICIKT